MLHSITWLQFSGFLVFSLLAYYGYVLIRYYWRDIWDWARRRKNKNKDGNDEKGDEIKSAGQEGAKVEEIAMEKKEPVVGQGSMFPSPSAVEGLTPAVDDKTPELFKVTEKVAALLREVMNEAAATGISRADLEDRIQKVLAEYRYLVKTPYEVAINNFISRTCRTQFSLTLTEEDLRRLWGR
jgi:hypothetical protein